VTMGPRNTSKGPCAFQATYPPNVLLTLIHIECGKSTEREVAAVLCTRLQRDREIIIRFLTHMA